MINTVIQKRLSAIEVEVRMLRAKVARRPNLAVDDANWKKVRPLAKKIRAKLYKARYG
jgi:hypothetical protein